MSPAIARSVSTFCKMTNHLGNYGDYGGPRAALLLSHFLTPTKLACEFICNFTAFISTFPLFNVLPFRSVSSLCTVFTAFRDFFFHALSNSMQPVTCDGRKTSCHPLRAGGRLMVCSSEGLLCDVSPLIFPLRLTVWTTKAKQRARTPLTLRGAADCGPGQKGATT